MLAFVKNQSLIVLLIYVFGKTTSSDCSWDDYLDNIVVQSKNSLGIAQVDKAVIIGMDGGSPWTCASHQNSLVLRKGESAKIATCFKSKDFSPLITDGIDVGGVKFQFLREEDGKFVFGKRKDGTSIVLAASKTAIVIGVSIPDGQTSLVTDAVAVIAKYLEEIGF